MPEHEYYIRSTKQLVGNSCLWWRQYEAGYTCDLKQAGLYTLEFVKSLDGSCAVAYHKDQIEHLIEHHVTFPVLCKSGTEGC
jgi:hypothetical protein